MSTPAGSVVIPAHNEARVIGRMLSALAEGLPEGTDVVVACNGCTDGTPQVARRAAACLSLQVLDLRRPSKIEALNEADAVLATLPRAYVDADVVVSGRSVAEVFAVLRSDPSVLVARPPLVYDTLSAAPLVRAFYRARSRTPSLMTAMWGAGFFAVSAAGRERWGAFPLGADDYYVDSLFERRSQRVIDTEPVVVTPPRTVGALVRTLGRVYAGHPRGRSPAPPRSSGRTLIDVLRATRGRPLRLVDASVYAGVAVWARVLRRVRPAEAAGWARDDTTR